MVVITIFEVNLIRDYVTLKNNSNSATNLKGWFILDTTPTNQKQHKFIFEKDFWLAPDAEVKIWSGVGNDEANNIYQNRGAPIWNNPGDTAELYDSVGNLIDSKTVGSPPTMPTGGRGPAPPKPPAKIKISGFVNDNVCGQGIASAKLTFQVLKGQEEIKAETDRNGNYEAELTGGRDYTVTITATNYDDLSSTINTRAGKDLTKNFKLEPRIEIDLGVKSTEVKFTRKDDNKINATQELKDKIIVDFNSDYTFTVKLSIKKGMTNKIKAILVENGTINKDSRESNVCRISDDDKTITFTFNPIKQKWEWGVLDTFLYVDFEKTKSNLERSFDYVLGLEGSYGNNEFSTKESIALGTIVVMVNGEKLAYLTKYTFLVDIWWKALGAVAALTVAVALAPWLAPALAAAIVAAAILTEQKDAALTSAKDPPQFDKNYKKLIKLKLNIKTRNVRKRVKQVSLILDSVMLSRDRLYSAYVKQDKKLTTRQFRNTKKLLSLYDTNAKVISMQIRGATKTLKKYKNYIDVKAVAQFRKSIRKKVLPRSLLVNAIRSVGVSEKDVQTIVHAFANKKFADKDLSLASHLDKLPKLIDSFNNLLVKNIRNEIECYKQVEE